MTYSRPSACFNWWWIYSTRVATCLVFDRTIRFF